MTGPIGLLKTEPRESCRTFWIVYPRRGLFVSHTDLAHWRPAWQVQQPMGAPWAEKNCWHPRTWPEGACERWVPARYSGTRSGDHYRDIQESFLKGTERREKHFTPQIVTNQTAEPPALESYSKPPITGEPIRRDSLTTWFFLWNHTSLNSKLHHSFLNQSEGFSNPMDFDGIIQQSILNCKLKIKYQFQWVCM